MNKFTFKIILILILAIFFTFIIASEIITQIKLFNMELSNEQLTIDVFKLGLNDDSQEPENLSTYQKFQKFWDEVYSKDAANWSHLDWRNYIILEIYGTSEDNLNNTIKEDPLFENNIEIFTLYVMGKYNGSLSEEDVMNLKSQLIHNSVHITDISLLKCDDSQLKIFVNIEIESSPSMWYIADSLEIYLKSENSTGLWYDYSNTHFIKVCEISSLELFDSTYTDGKHENHIVGPIIINSNTIEKNVTLLAKVGYYLNFLIDECVEQTKFVDIIDDDNLIPQINYTYTGDYSDGNPGELIITAFDESGLSIDPSGIYVVPYEIDNYEFTFTACDADNDRPEDMLNSTITVWVNITDDDTSPPELSYIYTGGGTDGNPGVIIVNSSDLSGLSIDPSGTYEVPCEVGYYEFTFTACDADNDRPEDMLNTTITVWINITDDDTSLPELSYIYTGGGTDGNPGVIIVNSSDLSGLSRDPSGTYEVPCEVGYYEFTFTACDADNDRPEDMLNTTITVWINITDDDTSLPEISYIYSGDGTDANPGELIITAFDELGLSMDPSGIYKVPAEIGYYEFTFTACDADNDRPEDMLNSTITVWVNITDDDTSPPELSYIYTGGGTDGNPGVIIVNSSDLSGLSRDPSGTYEVPCEVGYYEFTFTACDADNDRSEDMLNSTITVWINITDDDDEGPKIHDVEIINNIIYDYYDIIIVNILVEDFSNISEIYIDFNGSRFYDEGNNQILIESPKIPGIIYNFTIVAMDNDNDRELDQKSSEILWFFEIIDDDTTPPEVNIYYDNINYLISINDIDGAIDSEATGTFYLFDEAGNILFSDVISEEDQNYTIPIPLKPGNYTLEIHSTNNDLEYAGDEESNNLLYIINVDLELCFQRLDQLLQNLKDYVDQNLCEIIAENIRFKLILAQENLIDAYLLIKEGSLSSGVFNELIIQGLIEFVEFETEFYNKINMISEEIQYEIILSLHQIRNIVILLIGTSVDYVKGINIGYDIASIEVELLNLADYIEAELGGYSTCYLKNLMKLSALQLELAVIKLSRGINPDSTLSLTQQFINRAIVIVNNLVENNKISDDVRSLLLEKLNLCFIKIEEIISN